MMPNYIAYYRVSTDDQGIDGNGMEAQKLAVTRFLESMQGALVASFAEVESGGENEENRPELAKALALARAGCGTIVVAKLDRLSRRATFILGLLEANEKLFVLADMPNADWFTIGVLALVAEKERRMISVRTKEGLAAAKAKGVKLGNPRWAESAARARAKVRDGRERFWANINELISLYLKAEPNASTTMLAEYLNARAEKTLAGKPWTADAVQRVMKRV